MPELQRLRADHAPAVLAFELANRAYFAAFIKAGFRPACRGDIGGKPATWYQRDLAPGARPRSAGDA